MVDSMAPGHASSLELERNILDAKTYLEKVNALGIGKYDLVDGSRFPSYVKLSKAGAAGSDRVVELPELRIPKGTIFRDMLEQLRSQLEPYIRKGEADVFVQCVKIE